MKRTNVIELLIQLMQLLLDGKYEDVEKLSNGVRYPAIELKQVIESHYEVLAMPPKEEFSELSIIKIETSSNCDVCVLVVDFLNERNERSDMSLECTFKKINDGNLVVQIDNLHVM